MTSAAAPRARERGAAPADRVDLAAVLCGGASRRMGADKATLEVAGTTLLARAVAAADGVAPRVVLACGARPRYAELGRELVLDRRADGGPLAGLEAALEALVAAGGERLAVLACDLPRIDARVLAALARRAREGGLDACLLATDAGLEPLVGVYGAACLPAVRAALERGERRMVSFHRDVRTGTVRTDELPPALRAADPARNLNTPAELERERRSRR